MAQHPYQHVAIAATFNTQQARTLPGHDSLSITLDAVQGVISSAGVDVDEVDGLFGSFAGEITYALGLDSVTGTAMDSAGIAAVLEAAQAITAGACDVALVAAGGAGLYTDRASTAPWTRPTNEWIAPFGLFTASEFALLARRHMHMFGTTPEQMATVAATIRNNGSINPQAVYHGKGPFTPTDILASRMVADPFHLLDCATTSEGACALLLTTAERAKDLKLPPVRILGGATERFGPHYQHPPSWDLTGTRKSSNPLGYVGRKAARRAFAMAGLSPADVDVCEFYDPFSFEIIRQFEAFEFCADGEGGDFVMNGRIDIDGQCPVTTDGGTMSFGHARRPQLLQRVARGTQQLQGVCPTGQVPDADVAMCSTNGSGAMCSDVILLGRDL